MKLPAFEEFLQVDEDGDKVFKSMPCPFWVEQSLLDRCPSKGYTRISHTDRKKIHQINHLTIKIPDLGLSLCGGQWDKIAGWCKFPSKSCTKILGAEVP